MPSQESLSKKKLPDIWHEFGKKNIRGAVVAQWV